LNHDPQLEGFEISLNKFSDWTDDEFNSLFKLGSALNKEERVIDTEVGDVNLEQGFYRPKKR